MRRMAESFELGGEMLPVGSRTIRFGGIHTSGVGTGGIGLDDDSVLQRRAQPAVWLRRLEGQLRLLVRVNTRTTTQT